MKRPLVTLVVDGEPLNDARLEQLLHVVGGPFEIGLRDCEDLCSAINELKAQRRRAERVLATARRLCFPAPRYGIDAALAAEIVRELDRPPVGS